MSSPKTAFSDVKRAPTIYTLAEGLTGGGGDMTSLSIRPLPGSCCPEKDCSVGSWDGNRCRSCGADCSTCEIRPHLDGGQP